MSVSVGLALLASLGLGMVHGLIPDEHTWPITFSYSVGSYSTKGGIAAGRRFSTAFTIQRAIAAEVAYFFLSVIRASASEQYLLYVLVGTVMVLSSLYLRRRGLEHGREREPSSKLPYLHGFIAGWGFGGFAAILYGVLVPTMPSALIAWLPGALFGIGTMLFQMLFGALFGAWMARLKISDSQKALLAKRVSTGTLLGSGLAFMFAGVLGEVFPKLVSSISFTTPVGIPNLDRIDVGFILAFPVLVVAAYSSWRRGLRELSIELSRK